MQLTAHDALDAHLRDELGISEALKARPLQAALASAVSFAAGATAPLIVSALVAVDWIVPVVSGASLLLLAILGVMAARAGGAPQLTGALRMLLWGAFALGVTAGVGKLVGVAV